MSIRKYLAKKLALKRPEEVEILCRGVPVGSEHTLQFVERTRWKVSGHRETRSKMVLEYRRAPAGVEARLLSSSGRHTAP